MFENLRKKLNRAIQEGLVISENLQQQYRQRQSSTTTTLDEVMQSNRSSNSLSQLSDNEMNLPVNINMAAGCNLLAKYESAWKLLHEANEENAGKAAQVAAQIEQIGQYTNMLHVDITDLITCLSGVPVLVEKLRGSFEALEHITALSATIETELERLEDLCEECELEEFMLQKQCELSQYKQTKMMALESYRQHVAARHQEKTRHHENHLRQIQRERQAVFDDAFRGDLAEFKSKGTLVKIQKEPFTQAVALEEVVLEDATTEDAFEEFLNG